MPTPAENSIANLEKFENAVRESSSPSRSLPKRLNIR
jgi:hypothetical protein